MFSSQVTVREPVEEEAIVDATISITNTDIKPISKTITFTFEGNQSPITQTIPVGTTLAYTKTYSVPPFWTGNKTITIDGPCGSSSLNIPQPVSFAISQGHMELVCLHLPVLVLF